MRDACCHPTGSPALRLATHAAIVLALCLGACDKKGASDPGPVASSLVVVQGANQSVQGGKELPTPVILRVLDADGKPMELIPVGFVVALGGGSVNPGSVVSDRNGEAKIKWTLGPDASLQSLEASVPGLAPVTIGAIGLVPTTIVVAQGTNQTAKVGTQLTNAIVIRVVGLSNTPMVGIPVAFQITTGGGVITPQSALTNALGEVTAKWTMGTVAGANALTVYVGSLPTQSVLATATP